MSQLTTSKIVLKGGLSDGSLATQDGNGRLNLRWNSTSSNPTKFIKSNEPAFCLNMGVATDPYFQVQYSQPGIVGENINFQNHLSIKQNGNVGIGTTNPTEKLDVNGTLKATDIILTSENNVLTSITKSLDELVVNKVKEYIDNNLKTIINSQEPTQITDQNIYNKVKHACSSGQMIINGSSSSCSGSFFYTREEDLKYGLFLTASHCVMEIVNTTVYKTTQFYITNPINNNWVSIDTNQIFYDGVADIAIIRTYIDLSIYPQYALKISSVEPKTGDLCFICGDPLGVDTDSMSQGVIRDAHYFDMNGNQSVDTLFITNSGFGGNSGSPILNTSGEIIGVFTFGFNSYETLGGGANWYTLTKSLEILLTWQNNKSKKYLGIEWIAPYAFDLAVLYDSAKSFPNQGALITVVAVDSPFYKILSINDLLLSATIDGETIDFGLLENQRTPGVLYYKYNAKTISITYIKASTKQITTTSDISFIRTYSAISNYKDGPLQGGFSTNITESTVGSINNSTKKTNRRTLSFLSKK